jgi:malate dehydrogenase
LSDDEKENLKLSAQTVVSSINILKDNKWNKHLKYIM